MQKVVGSSPIIRLKEAPLDGAFCCPRRGPGRLGSVRLALAQQRAQPVAELRVETVVPADRAREVVDALVAAHPYEEVAFDLYPLVEP